MSISHNINRILSIILVACIAALCLKVYISDKRATAIKEQYNVSEAGREAVDEYNKQLRTVVTIKRDNDEKVEQISAKEPDWADAVLPDDVDSLLQHSSGTARAVPEGLPD